MKMPRFTLTHHAVAVACVLAISLVLHGAFGLTGVIELKAAAQEETAILPPPILR